MGQYAQDDYHHHPMTVLLQCGFQFAAGEGARVREGDRGQWIGGIWQPGGTMARDHSQGTVKKKCERRDHFYNCRFTKKELVSVDSLVLFCGEILKRLDE